MQHHCIYYQNYTKFIGCCTIRSSLPFDYHLNLHILSCIMVDGIHKFFSSSAMFYQKFCLIYIHLHIKKKIVINYLRFTHILSNFLLFLEQLFVEKNEICLMFAFKIGFGDSFSDICSFNHPTIIQLHCKSWL